MRPWLLFFVAAGAAVSMGCNSGPKAASYAAGDALVPLAQSPTPAEIQRVDTFFKTLPAAENPAIDEEQALTLAAYPLSCLDHLQAGGGGGAGSGGAPPDSGAAATGDVGGAPAAAGAGGAGRGRGRGGRGRAPAATEPGNVATANQPNAAPPAEAEAASSGAGAAAGDTAGNARAAGRGSSTAGRGAPAAAGRGGYVWQSAGPAHLLPDYEHTRAFYGCYDWHSAMNSTWTLVMVLKHYPHLPIEKLARQRLDAHLGKSNIDGEIAFFRASPSYERPYGQAWAMKLYADLVTWNDPDAQKWAANLKPLVEMFSTGMVKYFDDLADPVRQGVHPNTANAMKLMLPYTAAANDTALRDAIERNARRLFLNDQDCPTGYEPEGASFLSPCLSEAYLMSELLDRQHFAGWFDAFMPPVYSHAFQPLVQPFDANMMKKPDLLAAKSHLVGLAFSRAEAYLAIANALPANDSRVPVYRRLAAIHGIQAYKGLSAAGYLSSHWMASYAMMYQDEFNPKFGMSASMAVAGLEKPQ